MKSLGIVRPLDEFGRVVLPMELRKNMSLNHRDPIEIYVDGSSIILKKHEPNCIFCGQANNVKLYKGKNICPECLAEIKK